MTYNEFIQNIIDTRGQWNIPDGEYFEAHHIIPVCMGGEGNKRSKHSNIIWLYPQEHYEAHRLLFEENPNNYKLALAWYGFSIRKASPNAPDIVIDADEYARLKIQFSKLWSEKLMGHKNYVPKEMQSYYGRLGGYANRGVKKSFRTDEHKKHLSEAGKELNWYTNGTVNTRAKECPEGFRPGYISSDLQRSQFVNFKWYTNGVENIFTGDGCPEGWYEGMTRRCGKVKQPLRRKPVMCIETGTVYSSLGEASEATGINPSNIAAVCKGVRKRAGKLHWVWVMNSES